MFFTDEMLENLKEEVRLRVSPKRLSHILGVERCAAKLGGLIIPDKVSELRAAALLHDIAKELPIETQLAIIDKFSFSLTDEDKNTPAVLHSFAAPCVIREEFSDYAENDILSAVFNHTVGAENMSVFDKIIFISDYVEETRNYQSCINVRNALFEDIENLSLSQRLKRLDEACIASIDGAFKALTAMNQPINSRMYLTKNSLLKNKLQN